MPIRKAGVAAFAVTAALAALPSAAGASTLPNSTWPTWTPPSSAVPTGVAGAALPAPNSGNSSVATGACNNTPAGGQGPPGNAPAYVCQGAGLSFVGPAIGQIASVIGPTIISPAVVGNQIMTSAGSIANGQ